MGRLGKPAEIAAQPSGACQVAASASWLVNAGITCQVPWKMRSCNSHSIIARRIGSCRSGVGRVAHLAGPHPGHRAAQVRVGAAAPEHRDHLDRLDAPAVPPGGVPLLGPRQLPVGVGPAVAILTGPVVDSAAAAQEDRVGLLEDPPHDWIEQAHGAAEDLDPVRPLPGAFVGPGAKIAQMPEDVRRPGREILGHAPIMPLAAAKSRQAEPR